VLSSINQVVRSQSSAKQKRQTQIKTEYFQTVWGVYLSVLFGNLTFVLY